MTLGGGDSVIEANFVVWDGGDSGALEGRDWSKHGVIGSETWEIGNGVFGFDVHHGALADDATTK